jgi:nitrite reductase (NADH) large subunit
MGTAALKYNLWAKITGAQRIGMFGANIWQLPDIWEDLVYGRAELKNEEAKVSVKIGTAGTEIGQAHGKSLRAVWSCVGTSWCRFGQHDAATMAVKLEERYWGFRAPHKMKMGVSGCMRECAEAQGKDIGLVATVSGYNLYICGNHGTSPKHTTLFRNDLSNEECCRYIDCILMYHTFTAAPFTRTSEWLEDPEGGVGHLKEVVVEDSLGLCEEFDGHGNEQAEHYECEWKAVVDNPEPCKLFRQFVNVKDKKDGDLEWMKARKQKNTALEDMSTVFGPAKMGRDKADATWRWPDVGSVDDFPANAGAAVKVSKTELAVYQPKVVPSHCKVPGYMSPSLDLKVEDVPNGLSASSKVPPLGWIQGRLAMLAIIGKLFHLGPAGGAWGDWATHSTSPLRVFDNDLGMQGLDSFWEPTGFTANGNLDYFKHRRHTELNHHRTARPSTAASRQPRSI